MDKTGRKRGKKQEEQNKPKKQDAQNEKQAIYVKSARYAN